MTKSKAEEFYDLCELVDDYFAKHELCVKAGHERELAQKAHEPESVIDDMTNKFCAAHNVRAASFNALRKARSGK